MRRFKSIENNKLKASFGSCGAPTRNFVVVNGSNKVKWEQLHLQNIDSTYIVGVYSWTTCFSEHLRLILLDQKLFPSQLKYSEDSAKPSFS